MPDLYRIQGTTMRNIVDAIHEKNGESDGYTAAQLPEIISALPIEQTETGSLTFVNASNLNAIIPCDRPFRFLILQADDATIASLKEQGITGSVCIIAADPGDEDYKSRMGCAAYYSAGSAAFSVLVISSVTVTAAAIQIRVAVSAPIRPGTYNYKIYI